MHHKTFFGIFVVSMLSSGGVATSWQGCPVDTSAKILLDFVKKTQNRKLLEGNLDLHKWLYQQGLHIYDPFEGTQDITTKKFHITCPRAYDWLFTELRVWQYSQTRDKSKLNIGVYYKNSSPPLLLRQKSSTTSNSQIAQQSQNLERAEKLEERQKGSLVI